MSKRLWAGISTGRTDTRILINDGSTTLLKARLCQAPAHPRALSWLLEAVALWEGRPVRAVVSAGGSGDVSGADSLRDWFPDFGGPLYSIEWTDRARPRRRRDPLGGLGDFRDLKELHLYDALESGR